MAGRFDIEIAGLDFETLLAEAKNFASQYFPEWKLEDSNDIGWFILELYLHSVGRSNWFINALAQEFNLFTAKERSSVIAHCKKLGYSLASAVPYETSVRVIATPPVSQIIIPAYGIRLSTKNIDNKAVMFENASAITVDSGITQFEAVFVEGESKEDSAVGDNTPYFSMILASKGAIDNSFVVTVNGTQWTEVNSFVDSESADTHYLAEPLEDGRTVIRFGNGQNGAMPPANSAIICEYRVVGEARGNIKADTLKTVEAGPSEIKLISATNLTDATGGADRESLEHAKIYAPLKTMAMERLGNLSDVERFCEMQAGVARAHATAIGNVIQISIVPDGGGVPSAGLKSAVQAAVADLLMMGYSASVVDPDYVTVAVDVDVWGMPGYLSSDVQSSIVTMLNNLFDPLSKDANGVYVNDFGQAFPMNRLISNLANMASIRDNFVVNEPSGDVETISVDQIVTNAGSTFTVTVHGSEVGIHYPKFPTNVNQGTE